MVSKISQKLLEIKLFLKCIKLDAFNISPYIGTVIMSKKCELTGKIPMKGHNVSHANNKTKRRFLPNLKKVKFTSELTGRSLKLTVSNSGVRSVDKKGSFDEFLKTVKNKNLSPRLKKLKKEVLIKSPIKPTAMQLLNNGRNFPPNYLHKSWHDYLYWDTELEN